MPTIVETPDLTPVCPHCEAELREIAATATPVRGRGSFSWGKRYVYACPDCRRLLGVSHRKGFWAG
jgi:hypothetical protein